MRYSLTLLIVMTALARADVSPKPPTPPKPVPPIKVDVVENEKPQNAAEVKVDLVAHLGSAPLKLEIPRKVLEQLNAPVSTPAKKGSSLSPRKAITTGLAFTLALALGGLWFSVRRPGHARHVLMLAAIAMLGLSASSASWADSPPGDRPKREEAPVEFQDMKMGKVTIEVVDGPAESLVILKSDDADLLIKGKKEGDK